LFGKTPLKAQNDYIFKAFGGHGPFGPPPGYTYVLVVERRVKLISQNFSFLL